MSDGYILAIDEGSSSARAVILDAAGRVVDEESTPIAPVYPRPEWVELDPTELWEAPQRSIGLVMQRAGLTEDDIAAVGVTSHRETIVMWDRRTGEPVHNAIMWLSKQTDGIVAEWSVAGLDDVFRTRTGIRNDSFFSAAKVAWLLRHIPGVRDRAERGELAIGTPDTWLLWNLTGGAVHATEPSAASRTGLMNLRDAVWDAEFCATLDIPLSLLPELRPSVGYFGDVASGVLPAGTRRAPITAVLGDQQAGLYGQACLDAGSAKNTFGTAGVLTVNVGTEPRTMPGMCSSVAWQFDDTVVYEAEGVVFHSGQTIQWLRDKLGLISSVDELAQRAASSAAADGVYLVPAFAGLFDPHHVRSARAAIVGLTLEHSAEHVLRAGLEAMAFQTRDNIDNLRRHGTDVPTLKVDGGATRSDLLCQIQADVLGIPVERPVGLERTALGIGHLAGSAVGMWHRDDIGERWRLDRVFEPAISHDQREAMYAGWCDAIDTVTHHAERRRSRAAVR